MCTGKVKWFNDRKGFGIIRAEDGRDVYVHVTEIRGVGFKSLAMGNRVEFETFEGARGPKATNVRKIA
jgi:CspA family cold shock protein